ncbi:MAG: DUF2147 domain-containing protein [Schleiferiaceae bacterium]|jgi:uncharacterized protein (DUF2147 family)
MLRKSILFSAFLVLSLTGRAQKSDAILGTWWNAEKDGQVEIYKAGTEYRGRIVHVKFNTNDDGSAPKKDELNPNPKLRSRVLQGLTILTGLTYDADANEWIGGQIYDTKSGNTYDCYARLNPDGTLYFKGYLMGMRFIGRSTTWTRVKK